MLSQFARGAFSSRHLNLLNLHLGIVNFSQFMLVVFSVIFLYQRGLSLAEAFFCVGAMVGLGWIFRSLFIFIPVRFGAKTALIVGLFLIILPFAFLPFIQGVGWPLAAYGILYCLSRGIYWHALHTVFATLSESGKFGRQLGARTIFLQVGSLLSPVAAGLTANEPLYLSVLIAISFIAALIPLLFIPEPCPPRPLKLKQGLRVNKAGMELFAGWGASAAALGTVWPFIVYIEVGSLEKMSIIVAAAMAISLCLTIIGGVRVDMGKGKSLVVTGCLIHAVCVLALAALAHTPFWMIALSTAVTIAGGLYAQPFNAKLYGWAKETHDPMWFHYWSEFGWDLGNLVVLWSAAALVLLWPDMNLRWLMLLSLLAIFWCYRTYARS